MHTTDRTPARGAPQGPWRLAVTFLAIGMMLGLFAPSVAGSSPLGAPVGLKAVPQDDSTIQLSWEEPLTDGEPTVTGYNVYRAAIDGEYERVGNTLDEGYLDELPSASEATAYRYTVTAESQAGESGRSNPAVAATDGTGECIGINLNAFPPVDVDVGYCKDWLPSCDGLSVVGIAEHPDTPTPLGARTLC